MTEIVYSSVLDLLSNYTYVLCPPPPARDTIKLFLLLLYLLINLFLVVFYNYPSSLKLSYRIYLLKE